MQLYASKAADRALCRSPTLTDDESTAEVVAAVLRAENNRAAALEWLRLRQGGTPRCRSEQRSVQSDSNNALHDSFAGSTLLFACTLCFGHSYRMVICIGQQIASFAMQL